MGKLEEGKADVTHEPIDLDAFLQEIGEETQALLKEDKTGRYSAYFSTAAPDERGHMGLMNIIHGRDQCP